jgi:hypothetical protein
MSAGKGDLPRAVDGAAYRSNYDAIFRKLPVCEEPDDQLESEPELDAMREFKDWRDHQETFDFEAAERRLYGEH